MHLRLLCVLMVPMLCAALHADTPATAPAKAKPAAAPVAAKAPNLADQAVDPYNPAAERVRFFQAAGVDNELTEKEFHANKAKPKPFARKFDRWELMLRFDKNSNKTIDWFEADAYRRNLRKAVLKAFDADHNGRLTGKERTAVGKALASGELFRRLGEKGTKVSAADPRWVATAKPAGQDEAGRTESYRPDYAKLRKQFDADGDGKLSREERTEMYKNVREQQRKWEVENYDTDGDGKISREERRTMWQSRSRNIRQQWEQRRKEAVTKFDADGDGKLTGEERTAQINDMRAQSEKRNWDRYKEWDADGDGQLSDEERNKMREGFRKRAEQQRKERLEKYDSDGDGQLSNEERRSMYGDIRKQWQERQKQMIEKYDKDGDGRLSAEERNAMGEEDRRRGGTRIFIRGRRGRRGGGGRGRSTDNNEGSGD